MTRRPATVRGRRALVAFLLLTVVCAVLPAAGADRLRVAWSPAKPAVGDVVWVRLRGVGANAIVDGSLGDRPLFFFPNDDGYAALVGVDLDREVGRQSWRITVREPGREPRTASGQVTIAGRTFSVQRLTVPPGMVDLDPETERRALLEGDRLRALYATVSPERLWRGRFTRPVPGTEPGTGFGARRIINGQPRSPHSGIDYAGPLGTPVAAANSGRVALVGDYFFPGRLVIIDHGLGLYTLYFHLDTIAVAEGEPVARGQMIGTIGATGRATGPHLHFGVQVGTARVDPATLLGLDAVD